MSYQSPCLSNPKALPTGFGWRLLGLDMECQEERYWCWAAVGAAVARAYGESVRQCEVASTVVGTSDCCDESLRPFCDEERLLSEALRAVGHYLGYLDGPISEATLHAEIDAGRPVALRISWGTGGGHFILCTGYNRRNSELLLEDPDQGPVRIDYPGLIEGYAPDGAWSHTYATQP